MEDIPSYEQTQKRKLPSFCPNSTPTRGMIPSEFEVVATNTSPFAQNSYFPKWNPRLSVLWILLLLGSGLTLLHGMRLPLNLEFSSVKTRNKIILIFSVSVLFTGYIWLVRTKKKVYIKNHAKKIKRLAHQWYGNRKNMRNYIVCQNAYDYENYFLDTGSFTSFLQDWTN